MPTWLSPAVRAALQRSPAFPAQLAAEQARIAQRPSLQTRPRAPLARRVRSDGDGLSARELEQIADMLEARGFGLRQGPRLEEVGARIITTSTGGDPRYGGWLQIGSASFYGDDTSGTSQTIELQAPGRAAGQYPLMLRCTADAYNNGAAIANAITLSPVLNGIKGSENYNAMLVDALPDDTGQAQFLETNGLSPQPLTTEDIGATFTLESNPNRAHADQLIIYLWMYFGQYGSGSGTRSVRGAGPRV